MICCLLPVVFCRVHFDAANCLLSSSGELKIADFGLARPLAQVNEDDSSGNNDHKAEAGVEVPGAADAAAGEALRPTPSNEEVPGAMSHQVATRWYRAPELLYGARVYGYGVDAWGCGAVIAELLLLNPLFPGLSDIDQLRVVLGVLGAPTEDTWPGVESLPDFAKISFPPTAPQPWPAVLPRASPEARSLVASLLCLDPACRLSCDAALQHPFVNRFSFKSATELLPGGAVVPERQVKGPNAVGKRKGLECLDVDYLEQIWAV